MSFVFDESTPFNRALTNKIDYGYDVLIPRFIAYRKSYFNRSMHVNGLTRGSPRRFSYMESCAITFSRSSLVRVISVLLIFILDIILSLEMANGKS